MPRGVKGSGKPKTKAKKQEVKEIAVKAPEKKTRKGYPPREERISMAEKKIERLTKLNDERRALIEKTERKLNARRDALAKSEAMLTKEIAKKERLTAIAAPKEKAAAVRAAKQAEKAQLAALMAALEEKGLTVNELLEKIGQ